MDNQEFDSSFAELGITRVLMTHDADGWFVRLGDTQHNALATGLAPTLNEAISDALADMWGIE